MQTTTVTKPVAKSTQEKTYPLMLNGLPVKVFYVNETDKKNGGMSRVVTVCYTYNRDTQMLNYGASIYQCDGQSPCHFVKKAHRETATERLTKKPVVVKTPDYEKRLNDFQANIRKFLFTKGVTADSEARIAERRAQMTMEPKMGSVTNH